MERVNFKLFPGQVFNKLVVLNCTPQMNWFCSFQKFLSIFFSISNHTLTIIQRLPQCLLSSQVPRSPYLMLPSWEPKEVISLLFYLLG